MTNDLYLTAEKNISAIKEKNKEKIAKKIMFKIFMVGLEDKVARFNHKAGEVFSKLNAFANIKG